MELPHMLYSKILSTVYRNTYFKECILMAAFVFKRINEKEGLLRKFPNALMVC